MNIKLDHVQITVSDLKKSVEWYEKAFGFKLVECEFYHTKDCGAIKTGLTLY